MKKRLTTLKKILIKKFTKYNDLFIENIFRFYLKERIDNDFLVRRFYNFFSIYQYIDNKLYIELDFKDEKNHYIPVFILNNFRIKQDSGEIYQYKKNERAPSKGVSIKKEAANIKNYYVSTKLDNGDRSNYIEKRLFANLGEKFGAIVLENFLNNPSAPLIALEENIFATHAAFQYVRTPAFIEQIKIYLLYLLDIKKVPREVFSNDGREELSKIFELNSLDIHDNDVRDYYQKLMDNKINPNQRLSEKLDNPQAIMNLIFILIGNSIIKPLFDKRKTFIDAVDPFFFILPDSGCVIIDINEPENRWPFGWDFFKKTKILLLPLSPTKCLVFHGGQELDITLKELYRNLTIGSSYYQCFKYIYSDRKNNLIQKNLDIPYYK